jgi:molecular chaperone GrpE
LNDKYLRLYSDFDNYRKRTLKEKIEQSKYATAEIITKLLPVLDDFERAIKAFDASSDTGQALKDGTVLIYQKFLSILNQEGLEPMRTAGETFDTDFHEAITNIPAPQPDQKGRILDEVEKGYLLNGKVIRFAKVVVGS